MCRRWATAWRWSRFRGSFGKSTGHSALSTGAVLALYTLPYVLFGAFAGVVIDRFNKRAVMVTADVLRAGLVLLVPLVAEHSLAGVYALSFAMASLAVFFDPSKLAVLPDIVSPAQPYARQLTHGNR